MADYYQKHCYKNASACMQKKRFTYVVFLAKNKTSANEHNSTTLLAVVYTYSDSATSASSMLSSASTVVETTVKTALLD